MVLPVLTARDRCPRALFSAQPFKELSLVVSQRDPSSWGQSGLVFSDEEDFLPNENSLVCMLPAMRLSSNMFPPVVRLSSSSKVFGRFSLHTHSAICLIDDEFRGDADNSIEQFWIVDNIVIVRLREVVREFTGITRKILTWPKNPALVVSAPLAFPPSCLYKLNHSSYPRRFDS
jgi:hypothetical protein